MDEQEPINKILDEKDAMDQEQELTGAISNALELAAQWRSGDLVDGRCLSLVVTKLEEAEMWLQRGLARAAE